jgi:hypothetical protein
MRVADCTQVAGRAQAALLWGVALFVGAQLALTVTLEGPFVQLRDPEYGYKLACLKRQRARKPGAPLVLLLGSSRVEVGVRPDRLPPWPATAGPEPLVFNFALVGSGPVMQLWCLDRLLAEGIRPDWVLVECWPLFWDQEDANAEETRLDVTRLSWHDLPLLARYWKQPATLREEYAEARVLPCFWHRFRFIERWAPAWVPIHRRSDYSWRPLDEWGWLPNFQKPAWGTDEQRRRMAFIGARFGSALRHYHHSAISDQALRELLDRCRREGIKVALLEMPEASEFRALYPEAVRTEADGYVARLAKEYGVAVCDARRWAPDSDLSDGFHLLPDGATAFSRRLGAEVLPVLLRGEGMNVGRRPE